MANYKEELSSNGGGGTYANTSGLWPKALVGHPPPPFVSTQTVHIKRDPVNMYLEPLYSDRECDGVVKRRFFCFVKLDSGATG